MFRDQYKKVISVVLVGVMLLGLVVPVMAENAADTRSSQEADGNGTALQEAFPERTDPAPGESVLLRESRTGEKLSFAPEDAVLLSEGQSFVQELSVAEAGNYYVSVCYRAVSGRQINPEANLSFVGEGVSWSQSITFSRRWIDLHTNGRFLKDSNNNEVVPKAEEEVVWQQAVFGLSAEGGSSLTALPKGSYTLTVTMSSEAVEIGDIRLIDGALRPYSEYASRTEKLSGKSSQPIPIEAEIMDAKSDSSIIATYDRSSPSISPNVADAISLNIVGGSCYAEEGKWIEWRFDVKEPGFYALDVRYQQDGLRELGVGRKIYIDGVIPFQEFDNYLFDYNQNYKTIRLADDEGEPYYVYLDKGEHTLKMEVSLEHLKKSVYELKNYIQECNSMYRQIISITGASPDVYRDYDLDKELPELMTFLADSVERLSALAAEIEACADNGEGSETSVIHDMIRTMNRFLNKPYKIPSMLSEFKNGIDSLANLIITLETQSLTLDYLTFTPKEESVADGSSSFWSYLLFRLKSFFASFARDYNTVSGNGEKTLKVWINMGDMLVSGSASGRDQMQIIRQLSEDSFTTKTGISVEYSLVSAGDTLSQAILAGKGPDVALFVPEQTVANLGIRGVLSDVSQMADYDEVEKQIYDSAFIPFTFDNKVYAVPETQNFYMMFIRDDVFDELELAVPDTWDDFYAVQAKLAEKKMEIGIPDGQDIFEMLLLQHGGTIYNEERNASALKSQEAVAAFTQWTDLYVKYSLPQTFSFINRFRTGEMPLGIMTYTMYNQLCVAAPEIRDQWSMYPIPATVQADGSLDRRQSSSNTGCIVIDSSKYKDEACEFVKWWTDGVTQAEFGRQVESTLGKSARYNTANKVAFEELNWTGAELRILREARESVTDIPQTMITYYVSRCVSNAFRRVVYSYENPRDVIYRYSDDMDLEFERKRDVMGERGK